MCNVQTFHQKLLPGCILRVFLSRPTTFFQFSQLQSVQAAVPNQHLHPSLEMRQNSIFRRISTICHPVVSPARPVSNDHSIKLKCPGSSAAPPGSTAAYTAVSTLLFIIRYRGGGRGGEWRGAPPRGDALRFNPSLLMDAADARTGTFNWFNRTLFNGSRRMASWEFS